MKISDLFEMPQLINKELSIPDRKTPFYSNTTLKEQFQIVVSSDEYVVGIKHSEKLAFIGRRDIREDNVEGVKIFGSVEFKARPEIMSTEHLDLGKNVLQVDGVEVYGEQKRQGLGTNLYTALIAEGYTIISDNTQYLGGQALWKKLARISRISSTHKFSVYVSVDGEILMEGDKPKKYNGSNVKDVELWSSDLSKQYVLFVAKPD